MPVPVIDIGILTIRDDEFQSVLLTFPDKAGVYQGERREYTLRYAEAGDGKRYSIAVLRQVEQGNGEAQDAARDLLDDLAPQLLLVVGIAGGLPSEDITLGDVVVSARVNDYSLEARKFREEPAYSLSGGPIAKKLSAGIANLGGRDELEGWSNELPQRPKLTWSSEALYGPKSWQQQVAKGLEAHFGKGVRRRAPTFTVGTIATSDRLIKDPKVLIPWLQTARHLIAVEMESGGVYRAARERCPMLAIRGISDIIGLRRSDKWTKFACSAAAVFTKCYLRTQPVAPRAQRPTSDIVSAGTTVISAFDTIYTNIVPILRFPPLVYVAPARYPTERHAWAKLLAIVGTDRIPKAFLIHQKTLLSFEDPADSILSEICDARAAEAHETDHWVRSSDLEERRSFVHLLNGAVRDDLGLLGVWYFHKHRVYAFAGKTDEPPRTYSYRSVQQQSTITVVSHYNSSTKSGRSIPYLRHSAFQGRFRLFAGQWYIEITPTYLFTSNGKEKYRYHEDQLKGIKALERNRAVLSQFLLWNAVLRATPGPGASRERLLAFGDAPQFKVDWPVTDSALTDIGADTDTTETKRDT